MTSIDPKFIRKNRMMTPLDIFVFDPNSKEDILGELFAERDALKRETRFSQQMKPYRATRPAGTPYTAPRRAPKPKPAKPVILQAGASTDRLIRERVRPFPQPIKPIEHAPNPFADRLKDDTEALFARINRAIDITPDPSDSSNE